LRNIGSFNTRSHVPLPADLLLDVWQLDDGDCALELHVHPDDADEVGTSVMVRGADLNALIEAVAIITDPARGRPKSNVVALRDFAGAVAMSGRTTD